VSATAVYPIQTPVQGVRGATEHSPSTSVLVKNEKNHKCTTTHIMAWLYWHVYGISTICSTLHITRMITKPTTLRRNYQSPRCTHSRSFLQTERKEYLWYIATLWTGKANVASQGGRKKITWRHICQWTADRCYGSTVARKAGWVIGPSQQ
jgi:hypothetical protein